MIIGSEKNFQSVKIAINTCRNKKKLLKLLPGLFKHLGIINEIFVTDFPYKNSDNVPSKRSENYYSQYSLRHFT